GRVRIERIIDVDPFYRAEARELRADSAGLEPEGAALMRVAMRTFEDYVRKSDLISADVLATASAAEEPGRLADGIAEHLQSKLTEKQALLETLDGTERLERVCALLNHEIELLDLERRIHNRVRQQMEAT